MYLSTKVNLGLGGSEEDEGGTTNGDGFGDGTRLHHLIDSKAPPSVASAHVSRQSQRTRLVRRAYRPPAPRPPPVSPRKPPALSIADRGGVHPAVHDPFGQQREAEGIDGVGVSEAHGRFGATVEGEVEVDVISMPLSGGWGVLHVTCPTATAAAEATIAGGHSRSRHGEWAGGGGNGEGDGGNGDGARSPPPHWPTIWRAATEFNGTLTLYLRWLIAP